MYPNVITEAFTIILISIVVALIFAGVYGLVQLWRDAFPGGRGRP